MSRVGKQPISLPGKVSVKIGDDRSVLVEGPKGKLSWTLPQGVKVESAGDSVTVTRLSEDRAVRAMHGTTQRLIGNMVEGVSKGFRKDLEIYGVGFRAAVKGSVIDLSLGQSHDRLHPIPAGIKVTVTDNTKIAIEGIDKQAVGQLAADIRAYYPPEPYKAKGVRYAGEQIRRKAGKSVK
ncbi:MAG TPA: 50S ribosomal protein L6 [Verrucomicrobiales bacterium]|mgnify:FL=1|nr:50S ribosomal protein L6 [Verrucomicrobiales bacterium]HRJ07468.1 50S ribosomal protein L6 [Prosthecobacter sp.]HRK13655.1 50S ribosomal protein L6 [Prosthecobacter sp.]